eukprot:TRINITY_DN40654_c0_g1_i1.p1 TRINITY_DN40654_c0_g1~~TRINITY_DN40654_c0_g1_i1.p1  ORF type:complete len:1053 (+),score=157.64 TRINITY_DN40654_c0_g1_i1:35-3193(+)
METAIFTNEDGEEFLIGGLLEEPEGVVLDRTLIDEELDIDFEEADTRGAVEDDEEGDPNMIACAGASLPDSMDLRGYCSLPDAQGKTNTCVAFAVSGAVELLSNQYAEACGESREKSSGAFMDSSPLFIYYNAKKTHTRDTGVSLYAAIDAVRRKGACKEETWRFAKSRVLQKPPAEAFEEGARHQLLQYKSIPVNLDAMKATLAKGYGIVTGLALCKKFHQASKGGNVGWGTGHEYKPGYNHGMLIVGYSDRRNAFIYRNSWGRNMGDRGYYYVDYRMACNRSYNKLGQFALLKIEGLEFIPRPKQVEAQDLYSAGIAIKILGIEDRNIYFDRKDIPNLDDGEFGEVRGLKNSRTGELVSLKVYGQANKGHSAFGTVISDILVESHAPKLGDVLTSDDQWDLSEPSISRVWRQLTPTGNEYLLEHTFTQGDVLRLSFSGYGKPYGDLTFFEIMLMTESHKAMAFIQKIGPIIQNSHLGSWGNEQRTSWVMSNTYTELDFAWTSEKWEISYNGEHREKLDFAHRTQDNVVKVVQKNLKNFQLRVNWTEDQGRVGDPTTSTTQAEAEVENHIPADLDIARLRPTYSFEDFYLAGSLVRLKGKMALQESDGVKCILLPEGMNEWRDTSWAAFPIYAKHEATFKVQATIKTPHVWADSFFVWVDKEEKFAWKAGATYDDWKSCTCDKEFTLAEGEHTLYVGAREHMAMIKDVSIISNSADSGHVGFLHYFQRQVENFANWKDGGASNLNGKLKFFANHEESELMPYMFRDGGEPAEPPQDPATTGMLGQSVVAMYKNGWWYSGKIHKIHNAQRCDICPDDGLNSSNRSGWTNLIPRKVFLLPSTARPSSKWAWRVKRREWIPNRYPKELCKQFAVARQREAGLDSWADFLVEVKKPTQLQLKACVRASVEDAFTIWFDKEDKKAWNAGIHEDFDWVLCEHNFQLEAGVHTLHVGILKDGAQVSQLSLESPDVGFVDFQVHARRKARAAGEAKKVFEDFDTDKTGTISENELTKFLQDLIPGLTAQQVKTMFQNADCDKDGQISYDEFVAWLSGDK